MGKNYNPNMDYFPFACGALQKMKLLLGGGPDLRITQLGVILRPLTDKTTMHATMVVINRP